MARLYITNRDESPPMFRSAFLDLFSRVHFSVPLVIFIPLISYFIYRSVFVFEIKWLSIVALFLAGTAIWTFTEYVMHRFVFHYEPKSAFGKKIHFMFHGVHHAYPNDSLRLVMVPPVSIPLAIAFYAIFYLLLGAAFASPAFAGFTFGYLAYDMSHYAVHHAAFKNKWFLSIKKHHMRHHYQDPEHGYGVSLKVWDWVFRSGFKG